MTPELETLGSDPDHAVHLGHQALTNLMIDVHRQRRTQRGLAARPERDLATGKRFGPLRALGPWALPTAVDLVYFADSADECPSDWPFEKMVERHGAGLELTGEQMVQKVLQTLSDCDPPWFATNVEAPLAVRSVTQATRLEDLEAHATRHHVRASSREEDSQKPDSEGEDSAKPQQLFGNRATAMDPDDLNRLNAELGAQLGRAARDLTAAAVVYGELDDQALRILADFSVPTGVDIATWADACRVAAEVAKHLARADEPELRTFLIDAGLSREHDPTDADAYAHGRTRGLLQAAIRTAAPGQVRAGPEFSNLVAQALANGLG